MDRGVRWSEELSFQANHRCTISTYYNGGSRVPAQTERNATDGAIFAWPWKMVSVSVRYLFYQPMDEKIKTCGLFVSRQRKPLYGKGLVRLANRVAVWRQSEVSRKFSGMKFFSPQRSLNQPKATRVRIRSINQINCSISVRLLFLFWSREGNEREERKGDKRTCPVRAL